MPPSGLSVSFVMEGVGIYPDHEENPYTLYMSASKQQENYHG